VPEYAPGSDDRPGPDEELSTISYRAVGPGLPVVTRSGEQFGVVEHVLEVPELDLFDGIVVYTGPGLGAIRPHGGPGGEALARAELLRLGHLRGWLRFVDADQVAAITPGYVKCTFEQSRVALLPVPEGAPVYHVDMASQDGTALHRLWGRTFGRPHWKRQRD
jgi:hypothetical protein